MYKDPSHSAPRRLSHKTFCLLTIGHGVKTRAVCVCALFLIFNGLLQRIASDSKRSNPSTPTLHYFASLFPSTFCFPPLRLKDCLVFIFHVGLQKIVQSHQLCRFSSSRIFKCAPTENLFRLQSQPLLCALKICAADISPVMTFHLSDGYQTCL